jgi:hypothetical protein
VRAYWSGPVNLPDAWTMAACDSEGRYALALPAGDGIELWAGSGEFDVVQAALGPLRLDAGERRDWSPELRRWDPVRVRLVDGDGAALAGWVVSLHSGPLAQLKRSELTDGEGRASVSLPIEGPQRVEVLGPLDAISPRHVLEGVLPDADVEHLLVIDARQRDLGGLTGRLERAGWSPPEGFLIALQREADGYMVRVPVDAQLRFRCANLVPGNYCLTLLAENDLAGECGRATVEPGRTLDLGVLALPTAAQLDLGDLAPDAFVELACAHGVQACWSRETELVEPLPLLPGAYELRVHAPARDTPPSTLRFDVASGQHIAIGADLSLH